MAGFWGDKNKIENLFLEHIEKVNSCLIKFKEIILQYIEQGESEKMQVEVEEIHQLETEADKTRRELVHLLIQEGYLLPYTRRDFLTLIEYVDKVADYAEAILDYLFLQSMDISNIGKEKIEELLNLTVKQYQYLEEAITKLFNNFEAAFKLVEKIDILESEVDVIERYLIKRVSRRTELDLAHKILYGNFITMIANISDKIEDAGDQIEIIVAVRGI